jgi:hypothetical protein
MRLPALAIREHRVDAARTSTIYWLDNSGDSVPLDVIRPDDRARSQLVLDELRGRVSTGTLAPGDRLLLKPVSGEFGRHSDALVALRQSGLNEVRSLAARAALEH